MVHSVRGSGWRGQAGVLVLSCPGGHSEDQGRALAGCCPVLMDTVRTRHRALPSEEGAKLAVGRLLNAFRH